MKAVAEQILQYAGRGMKFSEMAVLVRTNTQPRSLLEKLLEYKMYKFMSYELKDRELDGDRIMYKLSLIQI